MANLDTTSGTITAVSQNVIADTVQTTGAYVVMYGTAHAGITIQFDGTPDGGTTWVPVAAYQTNTPSAGAVNSIALGANSSTQFFVMVGALKQLRVRSSAYTSGSLNVSIMTTDDETPQYMTSGVGGSAAPAALADSFANPTESHVASDLFLYNGTAWDRQRSNFTLAYETSSAKTATGASANVTNHNARGCYIQVNVTAVSGTTPTMTCRVQYSVDSGSNFVDLDTTNAQTASITTTGLYQLRVYPGIAAVANSACNAPLPRTWRLAWTIGGTTPSFTFSSNVAHVL